jgi:Tol biopolymer transport system component
VRQTILAILILSLLAACAPATIPTLAPKMEPMATSAATLMPEPTLTVTPSPTSSPTPTPNQELKLPENALIAYAGVKGIYIISGIEGKLVSTIPSQEIIYFSSPSWSPSGDRLVFGSEGPDLNSKINLVNQDGSGLLWLRDNVGVGDPAWSPDGEHIAYTVGPSLFVASVDSPGLQEFNVTSDFLWLPAWSPDARKLAILANPSSFYGPHKIYLIDSDGKNFHSITQAIAGVSHLAWSPDGTRIAFRSYDDCGDISVLDLKTGLITNLTNTPGIAELDPAWSSDGNLIVFSRFHSLPCQQDHVYYYDGDSLFVMRANGQDVTLIMNAKGSQPSWWPTVMLRPNWKYSVTKAGSNLNIRESPATSAKSLDKLPQWAIFTALDGPQDADGYSWWHIRTEKGIEGWMADVPGWYMSENAGENP